MAKRYIVISLFLLATGIAIYLFIKARERREVKLEFAGTVEAREVNISSMVPGRIIDIKPKEGDRVSVGEVVVKIEDKELIADLERAEALLSTSINAFKEGKAKLATLKKRYNTLKEEIALNRADYERIKTTLKESERELNRAKKLYKKGFLSVQQLELKQTTYEQNIALLKAAESKINLSKAKLDELLSEIAASKQRLKTLESKVKEAEKFIKMKKVRYGYTTITSPINGIVVYKAFEEGETVAAYKPILTVIDPNDKWIRIDLDESYLPKIKIGKQAEVSIVGSKKVFKATVFLILEEAGFATQRDVTRGKQDLKTFCVKLRVNDPEGILKTGMTVRVRI